jgi:hypothetical protein
VSARGHAAGLYVPGMSSWEPRPRGVVLRSSLAALVFLGAVLPGWLLAEFVEDRTGLPLLGWLLSGAWTGGVVARFASGVSLRRRDVLLAALPVLGWYMVCVLAWRIALLPLRDWEPRPDEQWRARWLTGPEHAGLWRADPVRAPVTRRPRSPRSRASAARR